jgi:3D (Asp-Asp-Asp) domain-containing protein
LRNRSFFLLFGAAVCALCLSACETTTTRSRTTALPKYEPPLAKRDFQNVRTTAYTHTESDHLPYGNHNALGGTLHAASGAVRRAEYTPRAVPVSEDVADYRRASYSGPALEKFSLKETKTTKLVKTKHGTKKVVVSSKPQIGSAAADWSRWPVGTVFRLISTGQVYRVDDYGWALAGRNTIDLYMPSRSTMNAWGAREENIQILQWGSTGESLRLLQAHQGYRHIRRMVLELEGQDAAAASLE